MNSKEYRTDSHSQSGPIRGFFAICLLLAAGCSSFRGDDRYHISNLPMEGNLPKSLLTGNKELGREFERVFAGQPEFSKSESKRLGSCAVVLVPGFTSDIVIAFEKARIGNMLGGYFDDQMAWLRNQSTPTGQVEVHRVDVESEGSVTNNSRIIFKTLQRIDKPVILIGHSKGGLEILDLLIHYPEIRSKVMGWSALQSPFLGSPLADLNYDNEIRRVPFGAFLRLMGGSDESLRDLSTSVRTKYYETNRASINTILKSMPHMFVVTWIPPSLPTGAWQSWLHRTSNGTLLRSDTYSIFMAGRDYMLETGYKLHSDGQVPVSSAILPGCRYVGIEGPDHAATIGETGCSAFDKDDRIALISTVIKMIIERSELPKSR